MIQGCAEPSSTLHPYALAIAPHNITAPIGANADKTISAKISQYKTHGKCFRERTGGEFTQSRIKHRLQGCGATPPFGARKLSQ
jgi:hypothetical protein